MDESKKSLHIAMFPWVAFGHLIPFLELAKLIAQKGHKISFISTPRNIQRLPKIPPNSSKTHINLVTLPLPKHKNLPENAESTSDLPPELGPFLKIAFDQLQDPLALFLESSRPDWIIYDFAPYWLPPIASRLGISCAFFSIVSAWTQSFMAPSASALINGDDPRIEPEQFTVTPTWFPFPSKVAYRLHEAKQYVSDRVSVNDSGVSDGFRLGSALAGADVIALRSCKELEVEFLSLFQELQGKPVIPIGLLPPPTAEESDTEGALDDTWVTISTWLDGQNKGYVVYIAFGSEVNLNRVEMRELAHGLELSGLPFLWVLKTKDQLPDGFEERTRGCGLVWTRWAPQNKILGHESVGGFLTHCGYGSVLESLCFGRAMIMLPFNIIDQGLIARVLAEKKVGVEVEREEEDGSYRGESVAESIRLVMVDKEGEVYRENAEKMKLLFQDKDLHDGYVNNFVEILQRNKDAKSIISSIIKTEENFELFPF